jgi:tetratricopeptide (TPR) repeat protein
MNNVSVPAEAVSIYNHALELSSRGDINSALAEYRRAIAMHPAFVEAYNNIGEIYSGLGNTDLAVSAYMEALKINRNYRVLLNIGVEHYNVRHYEEALHYFLESLKMKPDFLEGNYYAGLTLYNRKKYSEAETYLSRVLLCDERHLKANYLLSYIYYEWKRYDMVLQCLDRIREIADDRTFICKYYGFCYYFTGQFDKAVEHLTKALESQPGYTHFRNYLKNLTWENRMKEIGDIDRAIRELESKMMQERPAFTEVSRLGMLYIFKGENRRAEELLTGYRQKLAN